jgi:hypothetical protein
MKKSSKKFTTLRVTEETQSMVEQLKILVSMRDRTSYTTDDALNLYLREGLDDIEMKIQVGGFSWRDAFDQENKATEELQKRIDLENGK